MNLTLIIPYKKLLKPNSKLSDFNIEQQADIIADYFTNNGGARNDPLMQSIMKDFRQDPVNKALKPIKGCGPICSRPKKK